jgi:hypothetical protein
VDSLYNWVVFLHVVAAFGFAMSHGVSAAVAIRLRSERELERVRALLDLSQWSTTATYVALVVLLIAGIAAGFMASLWGRGWIWAAIVLLVLMFAFMFVRASVYYGELRRAAGVAYFDIGARKPMPAVVPDPARLTQLLASSRPIELAVIGYLGLLAILWLMLLKPF